LERESHRKEVHLEYKNVELAEGNVIMKTNSEIIGVRIDYDMQENVANIIRDWNPEFWREHSVNNAKELACRAHLGYAKGEDICRIVREGANWAVAYFEEGDTKKYGWYNLLSHGLLLCLLINNEILRNTLCNWAKPGKKPDYNPVLPNEIQLLYLCIASLFQEKPARQFEMLAAKVAANRNKEIRLVSRAFDAVKKPDQAEFENAILECVEYHKTKPKPDPDAYFLEDWLPLHGNTIYLAGLQLGLKAPKYPANIAAYLMTPESVGFKSK
jgi:hypothetical protein